LINEQQYNEKFAYIYSSLVAYPLIRKEWNGRSAIICPIPRYLFERITDGIYYEICRDKGFEHPFGEAFQEYVGDVLKVLYKNGLIYPEDKYEKDNRTVDWTIEDDHATLFIECKAKRLTTGAKAGLFDTTELESELGKIADAVVQVYKTMEDFKKGLYPKVKYYPNKELYPIVVTLENWYLYGDVILNRLNKFVVDKLIGEGLSENLIVTNPYCVVSAESFEKLIFIINKHGIKEVLDDKLRDKDMKYWEIDSYLHQKYPEETSKSGCPFIPELNEKIKAILNHN
ncbi:MAG: hypothetical protein HQK53_07715, partial [Oligoflexia bacterium]|nr:hypothetical protein [Oligoflexia bacterium]